MQPNPNWPGGVATARSLQAAAIGVLPDVPKSQAGKIRHPLSIDSRHLYLFRRPDDLPPGYVSIFEVTVSEQLLEPKLRPRTNGPDFGRTSSKLTRQRMFCLDEQAVELGSTLVRTAASRIHELDCQGCGRRPARRSMGARRLPQSLPQLLTTSDTQKI